MKRTQFPLLLITILSLFELSCNKPGTEDLIESMQLTIDKNDISISGLANAKDSFVIQSNNSWTITTTPANISWLSISTKNGQNNSTNSYGSSQGEGWRGCSNTNRLGGCCSQAEPCDPCKNRGTGTAT